MNRGLTRAGALSMAAVLTMSLGGWDSKINDSDSEGEKAQIVTKSIEGAEGLKSADGGDILTENGTYPIVKEGEELELSVFMLSAPNITDMATNDFTKYLEEQTGINLTFEIGGLQDWEDKLNMSLASGEYPDIIVGARANVAKFGVKEGILIPLDEYLTEDIIPNYMKQMGQYLDLQKESDGKIYSLSEINDCYHCSYFSKMWVNTYYLDQMGVEIPTTTDEFYEVCKKFTEFKPEGIAIAGTTQESGWGNVFQDWLKGAFLLAPQKSKTLSVFDQTAVTRDGKVVCTAVDDRYREFLEYTNSLYELGAIYEGNFTQSAEQMKILVNQPDEPVLFFASGAKSNQIDSLGSPELYSHYEIMAPIAGPDGTRLSTFNKYDGVGTTSFVITDNCENPVAALRWMDWFFTETGNLCSQYGPVEGEDWVLAPEGLVGLNGEPALYEVLNDYTAEPQNHDWQDVGIRVQPAVWRLGQAMDPNVDINTSEGLEKLLYDATKEFYEPYGQDVQNADLDVLPQLKMTVDESTNIATIAVEIEKIISEDSVSFIMGTKDIETEWENFVGALEKAGLQTLLDTYQVAYDRQMAE